MENTVEKNKIEITPIRAVKINDELWFVTRDVCDVLGISNTTMSIAGLEDFEKGKLKLGRQGELCIVSTSGFYSLILRSRKEIAQDFRIWVTSQVLPTIRKTGQYIADKPNTVETMLIEIGFDIKIVDGEISDTVNMSGEQIHQLDSFVNDETLTSRQQHIIHQTAKDRIGFLLGGTDSREYRLNQKSYFTTLWNRLRARYGHNGTYKNLKQTNFDDALDWISNWNIVDK